MGKKKKQRELTQAEIWDDSALIRSWDEAVEEYNRYHSIHAKGEDVSTVLREAGEEDLIVDGEANVGGDGQTVVNGGHNATIDEEQEEGELTEDLGHQKSFQAEVTMETGSAPPQTSDQSDPHDVPSSPKAQPRPEVQDPSSRTSGPAFLGGLGGASNMPQSVLGNATDESLKNLMMAWYFAGYYTGLYEGRRHGQK